MENGGWLFRQLKDLRAPLPGEFVVHVVLGAALGAVGGATVSGLIEAEREFHAGMLALIVIHVILIFFFIFASRISAMFLGSKKIILFFLSTPIPLLLLLYLNIALGDVVRGGGYGAEVFSLAVGISWFVLLNLCGFAQLMIEAIPALKALFE